MKLIEYPTEEIFLDNHVRRIEGLFGEYLEDKKRPDKKEPNFIWDTPYQRGYVWDLQDKQKLIQSFVNKVDIGKIVLAKRCDVCFSKEIVDGKQRLNALFEFLDNKFPVKALDEKYYFFKELNKPEQFMIEDIKIQIVEIQRATEEIILKTFIRHNTSGKR
ncbi:MAG TPA: DUF262 domain-containing protein, partial [Bacteroidales bacterium]|nr:DUF262 domain-containing protein [Bacteroidales bacterium]